jgi:hypothetical protein
LWSHINDFAIAAQQRGLVIARLEAPNGVQFTVVAGHAAFDPKIQGQERPQIKAVMEQVVPMGPVVVVMDSNARDPETDPTHNPVSKLFYSDLEATPPGFVNLGPRIGTSGRYHIDDVMIDLNTARADERAGDPPTFVTLRQIQVGIPGYLKRANSDHKTAASTFTLYPPPDAKVVTVWSPPSKPTK